MRKMRNANAPTLLPGLIIDPVPWYKQKRKERPPALRRRLAAIGSNKQDRP
jgi:hypothetical protein